MNDLIALHSRAYKFWMHQVETNMHAWTTIAMRLPVLARDGARGTASPETKRMVEEKLIAATHGAFDSALEGGKLAMRMWSGKIDATGLASGMIGIAEAAGKPARKRVKANARRLTRRG